MIVRLCFVVVFSSIMVAPDAPKKSLGADFISFVKYTAQDYIVDMVFSYMHHSFELYQKQHPVKYGLLSAYVGGKYIYNDMDHWYLGETLLHKAVKRKDLDLVAMLLFLGADPGEKNIEGLTSIQLAQQLQESSIKSILELYVTESKKVQGRSDLELLHQAVISKMVRIVAPFAAEQGLNSVVESLQEYGTQHPWLSRIFMYLVRGYRFDNLINTTSYTSTFLQRCIQRNDPEFAKILLYLGADPLCGNIFGQSAFDQAVTTFNVSFVKLFWLYVSSPEIKEEMYPVLEKYKLLLLLCAMQDYIQTRSTIFVYDVASYFNVLQRGPVQASLNSSRLQNAAHMMMLVEKINQIAVAQGNVCPFEIVAPREFKASAMTVSDNKISLVGKRYSVWL